MEKKFTLLLLGPAGSGKSSFVAGLSKIDILKYVAAESYGGANTTKVSTIYEFSPKFSNFLVKDCICEVEENQVKILDELKTLSSQENGLQEIFKRINSLEFAKKCNSITIQLPCKDELMPDNSIYDCIVVRDSRGLGDVDDSSDIKIDELGITYDVNAILFFSISQIQQPAIFTKIIDSVLKVNLKTPIFSLRRYTKLTKNDNEFELRILNNIKNSDKELYDCIIKKGEEHKYYRINNFVFNLPEVEQWAGVLDYDTQIQSNQIMEYTKALSEFLSYSLSMYEKLHETIVNKMLGEYKQQFADMILSQLNSETSFDIAASITEDPHSRPGKDYNINRDTIALSQPVVLSGKLTEQPFRCERSAAGNRFADGIIPSYSYSCVNFRNIFYSIVARLTAKEYALIPLFSTFMDISLEKYTTTASTGYQTRSRTQNAFKFDVFLNVRERCTEILVKNKLADENGVWEGFSYKEKYQGDKAIAVFIYAVLISSLNIMNTELTTNDKSKQVIEKFNSREILNLMKRS